MKKTINLYDFIDDFMAARPNNFTYEGLEALFEHLTELELELESEIELDIIALCCEYCQYHSLPAASADYNITAEELKDSTTVIEFCSGVIIQAF